MSIRGKRHYAKRSHRGMKPHESSTPGKTKGDNCKASPMDRTFARKSRAYRMREYDNWGKDGTKGRK